MGDVTFSGPLFNGSAEADIAHYCDNLQSSLADEALDELHQAFGETFRHPTGAYESHVHVSSEQGAAVVNDGGSVYGPWLEGTGSRNFPKTRFKGYTNWRRVFGQVSAKVSEFAERGMPELLRRIG